MADRRFYILLFIVCLLTGCSSDKQAERYVHDWEEVHSWQNPFLTTDSRLLRTHLAHYVAQPATMYADAYTQSYYKRHRPFLWVNKYGTNWRADSLLGYLERVSPSLGVSPKIFPVASIRQDLHRINTLDFRTQDDFNQLLGHIEFQLTQVCLRYACGCRYGFVQPNKLFNRLDVASPNRPDVFNRLYEFDTEHVTDSFVELTLSHIRQGSLAAFFKEIQPTFPLYYRLQREWMKTDSSTSYRRLAGINMERCRWRYARPTDKYVWVNLSDYLLYAIDEASDSSFSMKVCIGDSKHKTPLLCSQIQRTEFNPYWIVPHSILSKEIVPKLRTDPNYFVRNRMSIIERNSGQTVSPDNLTATQLKSGNYYARQDKGAENSLGRMIFRFPNNHAVYLHDTNSPSTFRRNHRAVSHGCVRLERPLDLFLFLSGQPTDELADRVRITIDQPAKTPNGRKWQNDSTFKKMKSYTFDPPVPVYLDYYTLYYSPEDKWVSGKDPYGYDRLIEKKLFDF